MYTPLHILLSMYLYIKFMCFFCSIVLLHLSGCRWSPAPGGTPFSVYSYIWMLAPWNIHWYFFHSLINCAIAKGNTYVVMHRNHSGFKWIPTDSYGDCTSNIEHFFAHKTALLFLKAPNVGHKAAPLVHSENTVLSVMWSGGGENSPPTWAKPTTYDPIINWSHLL